MKVLHVTPSFYPAVVYGGPTYSVYALCRGLVGHGHDVRVLTTDANGPDSVLDVDTTDDVEVSPGLKVRYCHRVADVSVSPKLLRLLSPYIRWADVVHLMAVYSFPTIPTLAVCRALGKPVVWSPRGMLQRWGNTKKPQLKAVWERVCGFVSPGQLVLHATSDTEARESQSRLPVAETVVVPNGVDIPDFIITNNNHHERRLSYLGRLDPKKGIENLLEAYNRIQSLSGTMSLVIAGEGDPAYVDSLKQRIRELGISETVRMIGHVEGEAKREFFQTSDVLIVPSHTENFGIVVAEALAHGVPVIASRGTPWNRLEEQGCGLWVDNDPASLAAAIHCINSMPLRDMGMRGREWMRREFGWDSLAKQMAAVYRNLLEKNQSRASYSTSHLQTKC